MLSFLRKSPPSYKDKVWKTRHAMLKGMVTDSLQAISDSGSAFILSWFEDRKETLLKFLQDNKVPFTDSALP